MVCWATKILGLYKYQSLIDAGNGNETVFGNPDITWETVHMLNIGADIRLFKDLSITFDYYDKLTTDMIITPADFIYRRYFFSTVKFR